MEGIFPCDDRGANFTLSPVVVRRYFRFIKKCKERVVVFFESLQQSIAIRVIEGALAEGAKAQVNPRALGIEIGSVAVRSPGKAQGVFEEPFERFVEGGPFISCVLGADFFQFTKQMGKTKLPLSVHLVIGAEEIADERSLKTIREETIEHGGAA